MARIGWYLLFLVALAIYIWLISYIQKKQQPAARSHIGRFIANQLQIMIGLIPIVVIPWILTGFFNRNFLLLVVVAFEISSVFSYVSSRLTSEQSGLRSRLWSAEVLGIPSAPDEDEWKRLDFRVALRRSKRLLVFFSIMFLVLVGCVVYFAIASYVYFANPLHSDIAVRKILTLNLGLYVFGALIAAFTNIRQISSTQISDSMRRALFLTQAAHALQIGIILTVYLGLIGIGIERFVPSSLTLPTAYRHYVPFVVLTTFYLLILVMPYFAGLAGRRRAQLSLYQIILKWITAIIDAVGIPGHKDADQIAKLRDDFNRETDKWIDSEPMVKDFAVKIERAGTNTALLNKPLQELVEPYHALKDQDLRFVRFTWTEAIKAKLDEMFEEYNRYVTQPNQLEMYVMLGGSYERFFRDEHRLYEEKLKLAEQRRILAPVLARSVGVLGAVPVVLQYGEKLIGFLPFTR